MKLAFFFLLLLPYLAFASVFKCTDDRGRVTFSTFPCSDKAEFIYYAPLPDSSPLRQVLQPSEQVLMPVSALLIPYKNGYFISGSIKGVPVRFLVDTGASDIAISRKVADQARIFDCRPRKYHTANGIIDSCVATVSEVTFGNFVIHNIELSYAAYPRGADPGKTDSDALLGMSALKHFKIEQQGGVLKISR